MSRHPRDAAIALALFIGTIVYLWFWPRELNGFDESLYLYEAKRVYEGAVMYRDFFDLITPAWFYLVGGLYALFGVHIETARGLMAVNHGLIGVLIFVLCRLVGVRSILSACLAMTHLALAYPGCPIATPHWCSTLLTLVLLFVLLRWPPTTLIRAVWCGALGGLLTVVQQQKGVLMIAGAGVVLLVDAVLESPRPPAAAVARRLMGYGAGVLGVTAPVLLPFIALAGFDEVFRATVRVPLVNYRAMVGGNIPWGGYWPGIIPHGYIIKYLPAVVPAAALWLLWRWWSVRRLSSLRVPAVLLIYAAFALWSVWYLPDHLHFSYVAPVWFVLAGCVVESVTGGTRIGRALPVVAFVLIGAGGWQLLDTLQTWRARCRFRFDTPFGQLDTQNPEAGAVYAWFNDLFRGAGATHIFAFPTSPGLYLITGTDNPTRYQILQPRYTDRAQLGEIIADLDRHHTPFVVRNFFFAPKEVEPLSAYIDEQYEKLAVPPSFKTTNFIGVYRRKAPAPVQRSF